MTVEQITKYARESKECKGSMITECEKRTAYMLKNGVSGVSNNEVPNTSRWHPTSHHWFSCLNLSN